MNTSIKTTESLPSRYPVITIDGPSGSGKGTACWRLSQELGYRLLDSGALYRIIGCLANQAGLIADKDDVHHSTDDVFQKEDDIIALANQLDIEFVLNNASQMVDIKANGKIINSLIRNELAGFYASQVAVLPKLRQSLLALQRNMALHSGLVADGRDMGTVVFPDADVKIFLMASAKVRAERRFNQLVKTQPNVDYHSILKSIEQRDAQDEKRKTAPSKPATDALIIDSSDLDADAVYAIIKQHCQSKGIFFKD